MLKFKLMQKIYGFNIPLKFLFRCTVAEFIICNLEISPFRQRYFGIYNRVLHYLRLCLLKFRRKLRFCLLRNYALDKIYALASEYGKTRTVLKGYIL